MNNQSFNSPEKNSIRKDWGKPLLKFLNRHLKLKLSYMGLPSPQTEDIDEWLEYIDEVIAFQCRQYPKASHSDQNREAIVELEHKLMEYRRQEKLKSFSVYDGYLEEVLLKGRDLQNKIFQQSGAVKVYNLDFCNKITDPIKFVDADGAPQKAYKFDAIDKILQYQQQAECIKKFVLFLTIQASYNGKDLNHFLTNPDNTGHAELLNDANKMCKSDRKKHILRLFVIDTLERKLRNYKFTPHFLPTIAYSGLSNQNLLHFTLFACEDENPHRVSWYQNLNDLCGVDNFLEVDNNCSEYNNPVNLFSNSTTHAKAWA